IDFTVTVPAETDTGDNGDNGDNEDNGDDEYATELFISEYIEGSGYNKAVEIYNGTGEEVDLSQYEFRLYSNGSTDTEQGYELSGTLEHGETYVSVNSQADTSLVDIADYTENYPNAVANYNGDDAIELVKDGTVIDTFGEVGEDPGDDGWTVDDGSTTDHTLVRKASVRGPSETFDPSEWDVYPADTFDYIGSHTME
ncbi:MAG: lamin tail domain-containing protein, partial [Candidatus Izemoplasmataceae bacterium]